MSEYPTFGHRVVTQALAERLRKLFPKATSVDFDVAAADLADAVESAAIATVNAREQALHATLQGLMGYYGSLLHDAEHRIFVLEKQRADLKAALNRRQDLEVASR